MTPLVDWVSCSFKAVKNPRRFFGYLGLNYSAFVPAGGNKTYRMESSWWYNGISLYYSKVNDSKGLSYDMLLVMSGSGCRTYETMRGEGFRWEEWLLWLYRDADSSPHVSRLDIAVDVKDKTCPTMKSIIRQTERRMYISHFRCAKTGHLDEEWVYFGSPQSDTRLRIYNKALERGTIGKWVRFECQLRNKSAARFLNHLATAAQLGIAYRDFINDCVRYVDQPNRPTNGYTKNCHSGRLKTAKWWECFIGQAEKVTRFAVLGVEYNYKHVEKYIDRQAGNMIATYIMANQGDVQPLLELAARHMDRLNDKQRAVVTEYLMGREKAVNDD